MLRSNLFRLINVKLIYCEALLQLGCNFGIFVEVVIKNSNRLCEEKHSVVVRAELLKDYAMAMSMSIQKFSALTTS